MTATGPLRISRTVLIPEGELRWRFSHASGPGGQGVNTTDSRVELRFDVARSPSLGPTHRARALERLGARLSDGVLTVRASAQRSQLQNREAARERLATVLAKAIAPPARRGGRPSRPRARPNGASPTSAADPRPSACVAPTTTERR